MSLTAVTSCSFSWRDPEAFSGQMGYKIPPVCAGSALGSISCWACLEYLNREIQELRPPHLASFHVKEGCWAFLSDIWAHLIPSGESRLREKKTHFNLFTSWSHYVFHNPDLMTCEGWRRREGFFSTRPQARLCKTYQRKDLRMRANWLLLPKCICPTSSPH